MVRLKDFEDNLLQSGLVTPEVLSRFAADLTQTELKSLVDSNSPTPSIRSNQEIEESALHLAQSLVKAKLLTQYQVRQLFKGVTKGFFLGPYRILQPLGHGGSGRVYQAIDSRAVRLVALKVLTSQNRGQDQLKRFQREIDLSRRLFHPKVVSCLDDGMDHEVRYFAMPFVQGDNLYNLVKGGEGARWSARALARYVLNVLEGLQAIHEAGLVHRDIKPSNLMVTPRGDACILDLGLARVVGEPEPSTPPNVIIGTLDYISPEQLRNPHQVDPRADLYSLGCTLYFALTGRAPFEGGTLVNKIFKHRVEMPEPLAVVSSGVPERLAGIVERLLAKNPATRYASASALAAEIHGFLEPSHGERPRTA